MHSLSLLTNLPDPRAAARRLPRLLPALLLLVGLACTANLQAHVANQSYVYLRITEDAIHGTMQASLSDINKATGLDLPFHLSEEELQPYLPQLQAYFRDHLSFSSRQGDHPIEFTGLKNLETDAYGTIAGLLFELRDLAVVPDTLFIQYDGIFHADQTHRGFALIEYNWKMGIHNNESRISLRFAPGDSGPKALDLSDVSIWAGFRAMVVSGMYHIYIGLDHILFLIALLLPAVVYRKEGPRREVVGATGSVPLREGGDRSVSHWQPVERFRPAFIYVLKIVTLFTVAHTITLSLAALGLVNLPGYLVESLIALSIALAAAHNFRPLVRNDGMIIAFAFGLFHGFGFASVLGDVGLQGEYMTWSLLGFNIGVELAQVLIICLVFPVLYLLRNTRLYSIILYGGSAILIVIALYWFIERLFDVNIPVYWIVEWAVNLF